MEVSQLLCLENGEVDEDVNLFDLGFHSLLVVAFVARVNERFGISLPISCFFKAPNLRTLAEFVSRELDLKK
jgi:acyl carrier protein